MGKNCFLFLVMLLVYNQPVTVSAQSNAEMDINFINIYNTQHSCIGIPIRGRVLIYAPPSSKLSTDWSLIDDVAIPEGAIDMDGNIGKNIFLTNNAIIFEESGRFDTLNFNSELPPITPRLWIRTPHSTEQECLFLKGEKNVCYYREYDETEMRLKWSKSDQLSPFMFKENRTQPILNEKDGFYKIYSFISDSGDEYLAALFKSGLSFYRYPMVHDSFRRDEILDPSELNFSLPQGTITAFIYDFKYIAVVLQEQIDFYGFDKERKQWIKKDNIPALRFDAVIPVKNG